MPENKSKKKVVAISIAAVLIITAVILYLSLSGYQTDSNNNDAAVLSDSIPGENNSNIKPELKAKEVQGYYVDDSDGWYYNFVYMPEREYDGSFTAGYDQNHTAAADNPQKHFTAMGKWSLKDGEIKLYNDEGYQQSMWACGDYIVDSQNFFVGKIPEGKDKFQAVFTCKAEESGDSQILNFYSDGKLIMEIIRNDGKEDNTEATELPPYQLFAGIYKIENDKIITEINGAPQEFYISDDGLAKWIYNKK
ncbi:MAG: hypothetical protein J6R68_05225 [Clostridia bacterium]|nr:hypothetical protein [Clostridia bacterium]